MARNSDKDGELDALAKRYLDLWESQLAALGSDRELAEAMARTANLMNSGATAFLEGITKATHGANAEHAAAAGAETGSPGAGPPAAASLGGHSDNDLADFERRLGRLEKRLARLEAGIGESGTGPGKGSGKGTGRRKS